MFDVGLPEMLVILVVVLLVFGPNRLPQVANGIGKSIREFKRAMSGELEEKPAATAASAPLKMEDGKPAGELQPGLTTATGKAQETNSTTVRP